MKKRIFSWFLMLVMVLGMLPMTALAEENDSITAYVTIANQGELEIAHKAITVVDQNENGSFDIDDTLYATHKAFYDKGASGYSSYASEYGLSLKKLWGDESGAFGYYVNDASAWSLGDTVKNGDHVVAFVYKDSETWSDVYSFFDKSETTVKPEETGAEVDLTLSYKDWSSTCVLEGAAVTVNGETITDDEGNEVVTNSEGKVIISFDAEGTYIVSAIKEDRNLVPPVCEVTVGDSETSGGSENPGESEKPIDPEAPNIDKDKEEKINALLHHIAASYVDSSYEWNIMEMAAYEDLFPDSQYKTGEKTKKEYIDKAIASLGEGHADDITYSKAIICLTALGIDAEKLYMVNSNEPISAVEGLNSVSHSSSVWYAPYIMAAYNQNSYSGTEESEQDLIEAVLENQGEDGSWDEWGSVQSTSNVIAGLSFYQGTDEKIEESIENAVAYLCGAQEPDGRFDDGYGPDANVAAMAVMGLCAAGVNPDTDARFIKDGVSALDALLSFALTDNSGFGYNDNASINAYATEQAFRALLAAKQMMETGKAFNIYDFSYNSGSLTPGRATGSGSGTKPSNPPEENDDITVDVTIRPDVGYWMKNKYVTVDEGATVYHAFVKALEGSGITQEGAESGYVSSMTYKGKTLGEFTLGENAGWLYKVNGELPNVGLTSYKIEDGDSILWYYTEDWTKDSAAGAGYRKDIEEKNQEAADKVNDLINQIGTITRDSGEAMKAAREAYDKLTVEQKKLVENYDALLAAEDAYAVLMAEAAEDESIEMHFVDVAEGSYYYDAVQWAVAKGITSGVTEDTFGPEWTCSRGQLVTFLWRMAGSPAPETKTVPYMDVAEESYYSDAVLWAMENDIAKGTDGISFSPEMIVTRAQAVTFLWRAWGSPAPSGKDSFGDVPETAYYHDAVLWAAENGITSGTGEGMFSPDASCQRGQIATFLYRAFGK